MILSLQPIAHLRSVRH